MDVSVVISDALKTLWDTLVSMSSGARDPATQKAQAVAELIRREMGAQRVSGRMLAQLVGKSEKYVRERVSGQRPLDLNDLEAIAQALRLDIVIMLTQAEQSEGDASATGRERF